MKKRKLEVNKEESKRLKWELRKAKNKTEKLRITIVSTYLWGKNTEQTAKSLWTYQSTVLNAINGYIKDKESFYKTKHKGKVPSEEMSNVVTDIKKYIDKAIDEKNPVDINDVKNYINKKYNKDILRYETCRAIVRKRLGYNYQKPYVTSRKQPEHAKEIAHGRIKKAIYQVALKEWKVDAEAIKNKKTKIWRN